MISRKRLARTALYAFFFGVISGLLLFISLGAEWHFLVVVFWFFAAMAVLVGFFSVMAAVFSLLIGRGE
ncbi:MULTISPECIES: hypothetical protein [Luteibacter]|uniref:hypothetical protein n=1 Tax=Luteibacter sp. dw_328 TaxID=2719796 RepID=UPI0007BFBD6A|nr:MULTISPECIES: hypothetical protein [Luteibacter]